MTHKYSVLTVKHASGSITWSRTLGLLFDYLIIVLRTRSLSFGGWPLLGSSFQFFGPHFGHILALSSGILLSLLTAWRVIYVELHSYLAVNA